MRCWDVQRGGGRGEEGEGRADGRGILILAYVFECNTGDHPPSPLKIRVVVSYYLICISVFPVLFPSTPAFISLHGVLIFIFIFIQTQPALERVAARRILSSTFHDLQL